MNKQLPSRPNLEQLKNQAKALLKAYKASSPQALRRVKEQGARQRSSSFVLSDAQFVIAAEYGFPSWARLKQHILSLSSDSTSDADVQALREAASHGDLDRLRQMLDARPRLVNERGGSGMRTALHDAAGEGDERVVAFLLERGADPNIRCDGDSAMPLHFAAEKQHFPVIRLLIEHGADPLGDGDYHELEVIGWATAWEYVTARKEIVDYLLAHGARHNISSAVTMGDVAAIRALVAESRGNLEKRMDLVNKRRRPLHLAVIKKQPESLAALLDLGANTESLDEAGFTALDQAGLDGEPAMAQILLDHGAKVRFPAAVALNRITDIEALLRREPDCLKPGHRWSNLIIRASERSSGEVVERLLRAGASVDVRDDPKTAVDSTSGYTPLHGAACYGNAEAASVLLRHGANVRAREERYRGTPAGWANYMGHKPVRDLILQGPIDLIEAIDFGLADRIPAILDREPEGLNRPLHEYPLHPLYAESWETPLAFAVLRSSAETVRVLLERGADRSIHSPDGRSLQQLAEQRSDPKMIEALAALLS